MYDCSPPSVETSFGGYVLYCTSPMEVIYNPETHNPVPSTTNNTIKNLKSFACNVLVMGALSSFFSPHGYEPFQTRYAPNTTDHGFLDLFHPKHLANNMVSALLMQMYLTCFCAGLAAFCNLTFGVETKVVMKNPLFESTSPSDFWGRKWNLLLHGVLKRGVFKPVLKYFPKYVAAVSTFLASGLFHEWILTGVFYQSDDVMHVSGECTSPSCYYPVHGKNISFFLWNAVIIVTELSIGHLYVFQWMKTSLPKSIVSLLVVSTALPVAHLFTGDYVKSNYFVHGQVGFPLVVRV
mmetsp:Transcript_51007/g.75711  ORF Transcript_51007/g.75711 Transcript_51007/m.75711 type:complete len:294 (-) Transcript_51007:125-1006(-)